MKYLLSVLQLVSWCIEQKRENELVGELRRVGIAFQFWEEQATAGSGGAMKKWSPLNGM